MFSKGFDLATKEITEQQGGTNARSCTAELVTQIRRSTLRSRVNDGNVKLRLFWNEGGVYIYAESPGPPVPTLHPTPQACGAGTPGGRVSLEHDAPVPRQLGPGRNNAQCPMLSAQCPIRNSQR
jgi:hypothetical protein